MPQQDSAWALNMIFKKKIISRQRNKPDYHLYQYTWELLARLFIFPLFILMAAGKLDRVINNRMKKNLQKIVSSEKRFYPNPTEEEEMENILFHIVQKTTFILAALFLILMLGINCLIAQTPGTASADLNIGNINATILNGGDMFRNLSTSQPGFEVPKGSGKHSIYAAALWIGGLDDSSTLRLAAQTYRQTGNDFWPGPLDLSGNPSPSAPWDYVWKVNKSTVDYHILHWNDTGYTVPYELSSWPANGSPPYAPILAPFVDLNGNYIYEPALGEFPYIKGNQATYSIFNDAANVHSESQGLPLGIEVHQMSYEINSPVDSFLNNTVFIRYEIGNRGYHSYHDLYIGIWVDFDLGNYLDDYAGTDVGRNMIYAYNADSIDDDSAGYGANPPAQGMLFLNYNLSHSLYYDNQGGAPTGNPYSPDHYYNYLMTKWGDGMPVTYGGDGRDSLNPVCNYMFPANTDPSFPGQNWTMASASLSPTDVRMLGSIGPLTLPADSFLVIDVAFPWARGYNGPQSSITALQMAADSILNRYMNGTITSSVAQALQDKATPKKILVYPNPLTSESEIVFPNPDMQKFIFKMMDISGRIVMQKDDIRTERLKIGKNNLKPGIFTVLLQSETNFYTTLVVVK